MRTVFSPLFMAFAILFAACSDNPTTTDATRGEIYGNVNIVDEYNTPLTDQSGLICQLLEDGNVIQTISTAADGSFSFKGVQAGVYDFLFFKSGYTAYSGSYNIVDSFITKNQQFVGRGRFRPLGTIQFNSIAEPDSSYWAIKPDIRYEVLKDIKVLSNILLRVDTVGIDSTSSHGHYKPILKNIYGNGTEEKRKIRLTVDYERTFPNPKSQRTIQMNVKIDNNSQAQKYNITAAANSSSAEYEFVSPNTIVRDESGKIVSRIGQSSNFSSISMNKISVQAIVTIPNAIKNPQSPKRVINSNELSLNLTD